jgi:hypothetical protein
MFIRQECLGNQGMTETTNLQVWFSTTYKGPDHLSSVFDENTGADVVKSGLGGRGVGLYGPGCPSGTDMQYVSTSEEVPLDLPFFYEPSRGNLLMEMRVRDVVDPGRPVYLDAEDVVGDSVSRVAALLPDAKEATTMDSVGIPVFFVFYDAPTLTFDQTKDGLCLGWSTNPLGFRLQWAVQLDTKSSWTDYPGAIVVDPTATRATIPKSQLGARRYFRLFKDSGSLPQSASHPAQVTPAAQVQEAPTE